MAPAGLFLLLYLTGSVIARDTPGPDVSCLLVDLDYVHCSWDGQNTEVNYTFYSSFHSDNNFQECSNYTSENGSRGCKQRYNDLKSEIFNTFYTKLTHDNDSFLQQHNLTSKVKLNPPVNVTVKNNSNNMCFYWNHTNGWYDCLENEVRYRTNYNKWENSTFNTQRKSYSIYQTSSTSHYELQCSRFSMQSYCTNLPSSNSRYELQVRFKVASHCGESIDWSDWSQPPAYWGFMNIGGTDVSCWLVDLDYVSCSWNRHNTEVNYTFYSRFHPDKNFQECTSYTLEKDYTTGCQNQSNYTLETQRFLTYYTKLTHGNESFFQEHNLTSKVKLYAPVKVTVKNENNSNLCFYWNHTNGWYKCLENEVRYRTNYNKWSSTASMKSYCTNLPSSNSRYELQVRFRVANDCGESIYWSDWSQPPAYWGSIVDPDVSCLLVDLDYVYCTWAGSDTTLAVNFTFYSRWHSSNHFQECTSYTSENGITTGCKQPYNKLETQRFDLFYTKLSHDDDSFLQEHKLKSKVKLYPPVNVTVKNDPNLCFYWNHTNGWYKCLENEVRYRTNNNNKWESSRSSMQSYCTNLPSSNSRYELQVRFRVASHCVESIYWSDWSQPVYWGSMERKGVSLAEGSSVLLTCSSGATPPVHNYTWWYKSTGPPGSLVHVGSEELLLLASLQPSQTGLYVCQTWNSQGENNNSTEIMLQVDRIDRIDSQLFYAVIQRVAMGVKVLAVLVFSLVMLGMWLWIWKQHSVTDKEMGGPDYVNISGSVGRRRGFFSPADPDSRVVEEESNM